MAVIDNGAGMKSKTGTSGQSPSEDSFPWFSSSSTMQHVHLLWDLSPSEWRIVSFQTRPRDPYDPDEYLNAKLIMLTDVTEILLEVAPSTSFRLYLGETKQVVKLTPCPHDREVAARWVDAIYAAMYLQNTEDNQQKQQAPEGEEEGEGKEEEEDDEEDSEVIDWFELREAYYQIHPEQRPIIPDKEEYDKVAQDIESNSNNNRKSTGRSKSTETTPLESAGSNRTSSKRQSKRLSISSMLDYGAIYNQEDNGDDNNTARHQENACCIIA